MPVPTRTLRAILLALAVLLLAVVVGFLAYAHHRAQSFLAGLPGRLGMSIDKETDNVTYSQAYRGKTVFMVHAARQIQHENGRYTLRDAAVTLYGRGETGKPGTKSNPADANRVDHIHGAEFEFDQPNGILSAVGDVYLDLDASSPHASSSGNASASQVPLTPGAGPAEAEADQVHIKTSGLVYNQKTRIATTDKFIEFHRSGVSGTAVGATYLSAGGVLVLQSRVHVTGLRKGQPVELNAAHAEFDPGTNLLNLTDARYSAPDSPRTDSEGAETLAADHALVRMTENNEPRRVEAEGHVNVGVAGRGTVQSQAMTVDLNERSNPTLAVFTGGVRFANISSAQDEHGSASAARLTFDSAGQPAHLSLTGGAQLAEAAIRGDRQLQAPDVELAFSPVAVHGSKAASVLSGAQAFGPGGATLRLVDRSRPAIASPGSKPVRIPARTVALSTTQIHAQTLTARFAAAPAATHEGPRITGLNGAGQTSVDQVSVSATGATLSRSRSTGDTLQLDFAPETKIGRGQAPGSSHLQLSRAEQRGHVVIVRESAPSRAGDAQETLHATAASALFDEPTDLLTLDGSVALNDGLSELFADHLTVNQASGDSEAAGNVRVSYLQPPAPRQNPQPTQEPLHVLAARATAAKATGISHFFAAPGGRVRLWQAGSQVEAPLLELDRTTRTLVASSVGPGAEVRTILEGNQQPGSEGQGKISPAPRRNMASGGKARAGAAGPSGPIRIVSHEMTYLDQAREIDFQGSVRLDSASGVTRANDAKVFLTPATSRSSAITTKSDPDGKASAPALSAASAPASGPLGSALFGGGQIDHLLATGQIDLQQPGRKATGDRLIYTAADQTFLLTGTLAAPPRLNDETHGNVTGALLRFRTGDDTVTVESTPGTRVHTETRVHPETSTRN
jgi:lipopolysaccharide export system protein LptA